MALAKDRSLQYEYKAVSGFITILALNMHAVNFFVDF